MLKSLSVLLCCLCLTACVFTNDEATKPLLVDKITTDTYDNKNIKQINIRFNQDIAILGAVPTAQQIQAVNFSHNLNEQCQWRFIQLDTLSCDLQTSLKYMTHYQVSIDESFSALGSSLTEKASLMLSTPIPEIRLRVESRINGFPVEFEIENHQALEIPLAQLEGAMKVISPSNKSYSIRIEHNKSSNDHEWIASVQQFPELAESGQYKIILQNGFQVSEQQYALSENEIIKSFRHSSKHEFYGFSCIETRHPFTYSILKVDENGVIPCAPERIALVFSSFVFDQLLSYNNNYDLSWMKGPKFEAGQRRFRFGEHIYNFHFSGNSSYEMDLSKLTFEGNSLPHLPVIKFKTRSSSPFWDLAKQQNSVVEADVIALPVLVRRNVRPLVQRITAINTKDELQQFLNGELAPLTTKALSPRESTIQISAPQPIDFRKHLVASSGLVHIEFSGKSLAHYQRYDVADKKESNVFNSSGYNLAVWNGLDLVIQAVDWDAKPIKNAVMSLVCEGKQPPSIIGNTDKNGMLSLNKTQWKNYYQQALTRNSECWLWSENNGLTAAIKLEPPSLRLNYSLKAQAWTTQPLYQLGDKVDVGFIARYRSEKGLVPLTSLDGYQLFLSQPNGEQFPLSFDDLSRMGFATASMRLGDNHGQGYYDIVIEDSTSGLQQVIGSFIVTEFTPPEFDLKVNAPITALKGQSLSVDVIHRRMNGTALKQARASVHFKLSETWKTPSSWPDGYDYFDYDAFENNENGKEKGGQYNVILDDDGETLIKLKQFKSTVPYAEMRIDTEVIAQDGSSLKNRQRISYFSQSHYIGTRYNDARQELEVIAIDYQGNKIDDTPTLIRAYRDPVKRGQPPILVKTCHLQRLPASCAIEQEHETLDIIIESGNEKYHWKRHVYSNKPRKPSAYKLKSGIKLTVEKAKSIVSGQSIDVILDSPHSGMVNLILHAGNVKKVWQQSVDKGINTIELVADDTWIPSAKLYASIAVPRKTASQVIVDQLAQLAKSDKLEKYHLSQLGAQRLLTADVTMIVKSATAKPEVHLTVDNHSVAAGESINITVDANQASQSQLWLLNDALISYFPYTMNDYDFESTVHKSLQHEYPMSQSDLSNELTITSLIAGARAANAERPVTAGMSGMLSDGETTTRARFKPKPPPPSGLSLANLSTTNNDQFVQSKMLQLLDLKAGQPQTISVQLPQLVGRWKVVALTATKLTSSLTTLDITTKRPVEYFVDAPKDTYQSDVSELAVTAISQQQKSVEDILTLWDGDVLVDKQKITLAANQQDRVIFPLPQLSIGEHFLRVTSELDSDYVNYHQISVAPAVYQQRQQWLVNASKTQQIVKPNSVIEGSISLNYQPLNSQAIDWRALANYNQEYPYQCWEQTISRALSYQNNPFASEMWPQGKEALNSVIATRKLSGGRFSFFEGTASDKFLTGYTYLVDAWLNDGLPTTLPPLDTFIGIESILNQSFRPSSGLERSMALLALAVRGNITLAEALKQRQDIGFSSRFANVLQALALKSLGADKALYFGNMKAANDNSYLDDSTNIYNDTAQQCFAALVYDKSSVEREQLTARVIAKQQQLGHFGSTFANGVCSYLLKDQGINENAQPKSLSFTQIGNQLQYQLPEQQAHWLTMEYQLPLTEVTAQSAGLNLKRQRFVRVDGKWQVITGDTNLRVGDLLKTTLSISSAIPRTHIAITDDVAGGLEVISPWLSNVFYKGSSDRDWKNNNHIDIQDGKVTWYLMNLQDKDSYSYYSRVRHVGNYQTGPATAEAMYRTDVKARTASSRIEIK